MLSAICFFSLSRNIQRSLYRAQCASLKHFNVFVPFGICSKWKLNQRVMKQKPLRNNVFSFVTLSWFSTCRSLPVNHSSYTKCSIFPLPKIESICRKYGFSNKVYFYCLFCHSLFKTLLGILKLFFNHAVSTKWPPSSKWGEKGNFQS